MGFSFCWIFKMYCWTDIINDICYKLFNYIQCIWVSFFFSPSTQFISTCLLIDICIGEKDFSLYYSCTYNRSVFIFKPDKRLIRSFWVPTEFWSICHPCRPFIFLLNLVTSLQWNTEIKKKKPKEISALLG